MVSALHASTIETNRQTHALNVAPLLNPYRLSQKIEAVFFYTKKPHSREMRSRSFGGTFFTHQQTDADEEQWESEAGS